MDIASSPLSSPPATNPLPTSSQPTTPSQYRQAVELPFELAQHVHTYYEEGLFTQAYAFLLSITGNSVSSTHQKGSVMIPSPPHLALACTLTVHPSLTTRTHLREKWDQASAALRLLRLVHETVGSVNARFVDAFAFRKYDYQSLDQRGTLPLIKKENVSDGSDEEIPLVDDDRLNTIYANAESIWYRAEDFWQVVGWAFNCSCLQDMYQTRWRQWELWLEFMLDVLETDWRSHLANDAAEESLLWHYIELTASGHAKARRIIRAVFADGSNRSLNEFREIFRHELKKPVDPGDKPKKREVDVDIDRDIYGDWFMAQEDSDLSDENGDMETSGMNGTSTAQRSSKRLRTRSRTPNSSRITPQPDGSSPRTDQNEGEDHNPHNGRNASFNAQALALRIRLLQLLADVSAHPTLTATSPTTFPDQDELLTLYVEFITPLPLATFQAIMLPSATLSNSHINVRTQALPRSVLSSFHAKTLTQLCAVMIERMGETLSTISISQTQSDQPPCPVTWFLLRSLSKSAAKTTPLANARISILLESLVRQACFSELTSSAYNAVPNNRATHQLPLLIEKLEKGINRRIDKAMSGSIRGLVSRSEIIAKRNAWRQPPFQDLSLPDSSRQDSSQVVREAATEVAQHEEGDDNDVILVAVPNAHKSTSEDDDKQSESYDDDDGQSKRRRKGANDHTEDEEREAWDWLIESGNRMEMMLERVKTRQQQAVNEDNPEGV